MTLKPFTGPITKQDGTEWLKAGESAGRRHASRPEFLRQGRRRQAAAANRHHIRVAPPSARCWPDSADAVRLERLRKLQAASITHYFLHVLLADAARYPAAAPSVEWHAPTLTIPANAALAPFRELSQSLPWLYIPHILIKRSAHLLNLAHDRQSNFQANNRKRSCAQVAVVA